MKVYYRVYILEKNELICVCATSNYSEAERQYDVWRETHDCVQLVKDEI